LTGEKKADLPVVGIPSLLRDVVDNLDARYPGIKERLCDGERLRPSISVVVDGQVSTLKLRHRLDEVSEVHFVVAISGG
jgi:molybdopterin synthase sulfur carrier subunit